MAQELKRQQDIVLNVLGPSFCIAYREQQVNVFFKRASHLWFLIFPEPEGGIQVQSGYLDDPDYKEHINSTCCKVCLCAYHFHLLIIYYFQLFQGRLYWSSCIFPRHDQKDIPIAQVYGLEAEVTWVREMNLAVQQIMSMLPMLTWADETFLMIERLVASLEEPPKHIAL